MKRIFIATAFVLCTSVAATLQTPLTWTEQTEGWKLLFDGTTLTGWTARGYPQKDQPDAKLPAQWVVKNGELAAIDGVPRGYLLTNETYGDFVLRLDFWVDERANSGVFVRLDPKGVIHSSVSYEVNIFDRHEEWPTGSVNSIIRTSGVPKTIGRWNTYEITARGQVVTVVLDGQRTVEARADRPLRGVIALQSPTRGGVVKFRNIRVRPL